MLLLHNSNYYILIYNIIQLIALIDIIWVGESSAWQSFILCVFKYRCHFGGSERGDQRPERLNCSLIIQYLLLFHPLATTVPQKCCGHFKYSNCVCSLRKDSSFAKVRAQSSGSSLLAPNYTPQNKEHLPKVQGRTGAGVPMTVFRCFLMMMVTLSSYLKAVYSSSPFPDVTTLHGDIKPAPYQHGPLWIKHSSDITSLKEEWGASASVSGVRATAGQVKRHTCKEMDSGG